MSHLVESMAFVNALPWHGIGHHLPAKQPIETWLSAAGMDWTIHRTDVMYSAEQAQGLLLKTNTNAKVLFRSDTLEALSVVSPRYRVVQPREVLEFYRDLVSAGGFELETAGVLKGGRKLWALARTGAETSLKGGDSIKAYLLLATSCDGSLCTTAQFTSVRVVCNNTLQIALGDDGPAIKVPHSRVFDPALVKKELGLEAHGWERFIRDIKALANRPVSPDEARIFLRSVLDEPQDDDAPPSKALQGVEALYWGNGKGADLPSSKATAWGLVNAITEYVDHHRRARNTDYRLDSAWFGPGAALKEKAYREAMSLL